MEDDFGRDDQVGHVLVGSQAGQGTKTYYSMKWVNGFGYFFNYTMDYEVK
jgi:hypothetical protein